MNRKATIIISMQAFLIILLFWFLVFYGKDEYESAASNGEAGIESRSLVAANKSSDKGAATLMLTLAAQQQSGIKTSPLVSTQYQASTASFANVEAIDGLLEQRTRYLAALAEGQVLRSALIHQQQTVKRMRALNQDDKNVSDRALQEAEAAMQAEQTKLNANHTLAQGLYDSMQQQWGATLAKWAAQTSSQPQLNALLQYKEVLIKVSLPFDVNPNPKSLLQIGQIGGQSLAKARFVSSAPQADSTIQGKTYFYIAPANNLRTGMRVSASLESQSRMSNGVIVPHEAVVWYANQAWVYQKLPAGQAGNDKFIRRLISTDVEIESPAISGWFNTIGFVAGDLLVTKGAQLLLSEELKYQITNENDD
ncbi:MAG: hypothetical protein LAC66_02115 [Methylotenera sp.]|nr:hypothetical protein [Methylotenera sp.]